MTALFTTVSPFKIFEISEIMSLSRAISSVFCSATSSSASPPCAFLTPKEKLVVIDAIRIASKIIIIFLISTGLNTHLNFININYLRHFNLNCNNQQYLFGNRPFTYILSNRYAMAEDVLILIVKSIGYELRLKRSCVSANDQDLD